jgi:hypothetical protein
MQLAVQLYMHAVQLMLYCTVQTVHRSGSSSSSSSVIIVFLRPAHVMFGQLQGSVAAEPVACACQAWFGSVLPLSFVHIARCS